MRENLKSRYKNKSIMPRVLAAGATFMLFIPIWSLWTDERFYLYERIFLCALFIGVGIALFVLLAQDQFAYQLKKYGITEEELEYDYQHADEVIRDTVFVGKKYMVAMIYASFTLYKIDDMVWMYKDYRRDKYGKMYYLTIYSLDKKKKLLMIPSERYDTEEDQVMYYFSQKFPHIVVGYSKETKRMFKKEYERFLQIKYYPGLQKEREQQYEKNDK